MLFSADNKPADCQAMLDAGSNTSGVYTIYPSQYPDGLQVYCDMKTNQSLASDLRGGWIVSPPHFSGIAKESTFKPR